MKISLTHSSLFLLGVIVLSLFLPVIIFGDKNYEPAPVLTMTERVLQPAKPQFTALLFESFEDKFPPDGWKVISQGTSSNEWSVNPTIARSGTNSAFIRYCSASQTMDEWLITPVIDLSEVAGAKLAFYENENYWADAGIEHHVRISTTSQSDLNSFESIKRMTPSNHYIQGFAGNPVEIDLSNYVGQKTVYIAFHYLGSNADNWFIDDVGVYRPDEHDVSAIDLNLKNHYEPGTTIQPAVKVHNVGLNTESFTVNFGYFNWDGTPTILDS